MEINKLASERPATHRAEAAPFDNLTSWRLE
ncbi:hypothetical protein E2C01_079642 [Portunus trituberculatus]|uniref:Uncharacterized protein n=1 Tax=Portunus trituberculatus TaxID=210409 RepID=A0A5B7IHF7_PORTR|nr:hypothetical protein [Portunus trituberculatus]